MAIKLASRASEARRVVASSGRGPLRPPCSRWRTGGGRGRQKLEIRLRAAHGAGRFSSRARSRRARSRGQPLDRDRGGGSRSRHCAASIETARSASAPLALLDSDRADHINEPLDITTKIRQLLAGWPGRAACKSTSSSSLATSKPRFETLAPPTIRFGPGAPNR